MFLNKNRKGKIMNKKYELVEESATDNGYENTILYRIRACRDIPKWNIKKGDIGGYVESEMNLDQHGECWIADDAEVLDNAFVTGNALISDTALISGNAYVGDDAKVSGKCFVYGNAKVFGNSMIQDNAEVYDYAKIFDNAIIKDSAEVYDYASVFGEAIVFEYGRVFGHAAIFDSAKVWNIDIYNDTKVFGNSVMTEDEDYLLTFTEIPENLISDNSSVNYVNVINKLKCNNMMARNALEKALIGIRNKIEKDECRLDNIKYWVEYGLSLLVE